MHFRKGKKQVGLTAKVYAIVPISLHHFDEKHVRTGLREYAPSAFLSGDAKIAYRLESFCWFKLCGICCGDEWKAVNMAFQDESNDKYGSKKPEECQKG